MHVENIVCIPPLLLVFETRFLTEPEVLWYWLDWLASKPLRSALTPGTWELQKYITELQMCIMELQMCITTPSFYTGLMNHKEGLSHGAFSPACKLYFLSRIICVGAVLSHVPFLLCFPSVPCHLVGCPGCLGCTNCAPVRTYHSELQQAWCYSEPAAFISVYSPPSPWVFLTLYISLMPNLWTPLSHLKNIGDPCVVTDFFLYSNSR